MVRALMLAIAMLLAAFSASAAFAQGPSQGWAGIVPGSNDYSTPIAYTNGQQACESFQNSFVPQFGYQVYGLIEVHAYGDAVNPNTGVEVPATSCVMDARENGTPTMLSLYGCGSGYKLVNGACLPSPYPVTAEACCTGSPGQFPVVGDPVSLSTGAKVETVTDYTSGGPHPIEIKRSYRSLMMPIHYNNRALGQAWRMELLGRKEVSQDPQYNVVISREDGAETRFINPNGYAYGAWKPYSIERYQQNGESYVQGLSDAKDKLRQINYSTLEYTDENDRVDTFNGGRIVKSVWKGGYQRNYVYTPDVYDHRYYLPTQINDSLGRTVSFTWADHLLTGIALPDGTKIQYSYQPEVVDGQNVPGSEVLTQISRYKADGTLINQTGYQYSRGRPGTSVPLLTGVTDAKGVLIDATTYDPVGRVLTAQGPGGADGVSITYDDQAGTRTVTNALGQVSVYTMVRDASFGTRVPSLYKLRSVARQQSATAPAATMSQTNDSYGFLATRTDWNGIVTNYTNDATGNETQRIEDFNGLKRTFTTTWSPTFRLPTQIVGPNLTVKFTYDAAGRLTRREEVDTVNSRQPVSRVWTYGWNALGLITSVTGPRTDVVQTTSYTYDANGNLATVKNALNQVTTINSVNASGLPTSVTDENGVVTLMTYDPLGRVASASVQGPTVATTTFGYDVNGLLTSVTTPNNVTLTYGYDDAHRLTGIKDAAGNATVFALNGLGNQTQKQIQTGSGQVLMANSATFDSLGRLLTSVGAANQTTRYEYDNNGNLTKLIDPRNAATQTAFDGLNRIKQTTDALNGVTKTVYDLRDKLTSVTDAKLHVTNYTVNGFGFVTQTVSPDSGTTLYTYDLAGNVKSRTDGRRIVTNFTYDALDRPLTMTYPSATAENVAFVYDATTGGNFGVGRLTSVTDAAGTASFVYDAFGNRVLEKRTIAGVVYTTGYSYDLAKNLTKITYPSGLIVNYQRDGLGEISQVSVQSNSGSPPNVIASNIGYLPFGPVQNVTLGNGVQISNSYDLDYRLTGTQAAGSSTVQALTVAYDPASNIESIRDNLSPNLSQTFQHDPLGRVTKGTGVYGADNYTYDALGNRLTRSLVNGGTASSTYTYTSTNTRLASAATGASTLTYTYDANGARTAVKNGNTTQAAYTYNAGARLATVGSVAFKYNAFGQRMIQTVTGVGTHFIFAEDGTLLAEHNLQGAVSRNYVYLDGMPLALVDGAGAVSYILNDHLGQPQKMLNASGAVSWHRVAGIYGDTVSQPVGSTAANPLRFPGQQHDAFTGLHYNYFRDYDPATGRYLQTDPIGLSGGANPYIYAMANPVRYTDAKGLEILPSNPSGLRPCWKHDPSHRDPNGERYRCPDGSILDFHEGRPHETGYKKKDHWHYNRSKVHLLPGSSVPDCQDGNDESFREMVSRLTGLTGVALTIYLIVSEGSRLFPPRNLVPVP